MKYFHFHAPNYPHWDIQLASLPCQGHTKQGLQCKRKVVIGLPFCFQHTQSILHLKVKTSTIPNAGLGLFAYDNTKGVNDVVFLRNTDICPYYGNIIDKVELDRRYGNYTAPYAIEISKNRIEDGAAKRGIGSLINHKPTAQTNCRFINNRRFITISSTKNIKNGQELFINYGRAYRFEHNYSTNTHKTNI